MIGLNLCPFASTVRRVPGAMRLQMVGEIANLEFATHTALAEARNLLDTPNGMPRTTLVVFTSGLERFADLLEVTAQVEDALQTAGAAGVLQVATFHPHYAFADTAQDDLSNHTNRSPYPIIHLLREEDVTEAVEGHPQPDRIPTENIARLREMGREAVVSRWAKWLTDD